LVGDGGTEIRRKLRKGGKEAVESKWLTLFFMDVVEIFCVFGHVELLLLSAS
jgi:hypothetical protein